MTTRQIYCSQWFFVGALPFFLKQPETFLVSVYISGRPDGRTLLGDIRSGVYQRAA